MVSYRLVGARLQWRYPPGEPGLTLLLTGGCSVIPRNFIIHCPSGKMGTAGAWPASGKSPSRGYAKNSQRAPPDLGFALLRDPSHNVTRDSNTTRHVTVTRDLQHSERFLCFFFS